MDCIREGSMDSFSSDLDFEATITFHSILCSYLEFKRESISDLCRDQSTNAIRIFNGCDLLETDFDENLFSLGELISTRATNGNSFVVKSKGVSVRK